ncbi:MAG: ABC transporter ATP-binding protein [Bacteroidia bacterium]|nr:ABC transporter ATP-binding protein [Bacteroidia bacterium]
MLAVQINNLDFSYKGQTSLCLSDINLTINEGERFGLFGPNGAGKTTLLYLMTGLLQNTTGSVNIFGRKIKRKNGVKRLFGFVPQDFAFYEELSIIDNLEFFGAWSGLEKKEIKLKTEELLEILGLKDFRKIAVKKFSGGMKRRVNLAIGVIHKPRILFLDEPTVGVDVQTRHAIINYLKKLNSEGTTLIYTSHLLNEAEDLCDRIALIDEGKIIANNSLDILIKEHNVLNLEGLFLKLTGKAYRD